MHRVLTIAVCIAGVPVAILALMAGLGWASFVPAIVGIVVVVAVSLLFALVWGHDLDVLTETVRRMASTELGAAIPDNDRAVLMESLERELDRLARQLATRAAVQEQHRLADTLILERLPDPILVLAEDRTVRRANAAARNAFGDDIAAVLRAPSLRAAIGKAVQSKTPQAADIALSAPVARELHATAVVMDPPLADGGRVLVVLSDRTRERVVERMRADFVANVSHELRTPLASLIGFVETLRGPAADDAEAQQRFLAIMAEQGGRMNRLIDDLLSLSRIELTEHQPPADKLDVAGLIHRMVASFEPRLAERDVELTLTVDPDLPVVTGDADQMAQVLQNLLDNGLKYGRDGGTLRLSVTVPPMGDRWPRRRGIVIAVADQGAGIPKEHLPRLTERFYRVDKGRSRAVGGTGLGLAIVKHIVNRHRGQLAIESEVGTGTTVSVWLPAILP